MQAKVSVISSVLSNTTKDRGSEKGIISDSRNDLKKTDEQQNDKQKVYPKLLNRYHKTPRKIIPEKEVKKILKRMNIKNVELKGKNFRISKRKGGTLFKIPLREEHTYIGILNVQTKMEEVQLMTKEELIEYRERKSPVRRKKLASPLKIFIEQYRTTLVHYEKYTKKDYNDRCTALEKAFDGILIKDLDHKTVSKTILATNYNAEGKYKLIRHLKNILELAQEEKVISAEQLLSINFKKIRKAAKQMEQVATDKKSGLSEEDVNKIEALSEEELRKNGLYAISLAVKLAIRNHGPRPGEIRAYAIGDVVVSKHGQIKIEHNRAADIDGYKTPKIPKATPDSVDVIKVNEGILNALIEDAEQYQPKEIEVFEKGQFLKNDPIQFLLVNPETKQPYSEEEYRDEVKRLQRFACIKDPVPPRYLRHTFASLAKESGFPEEFIFNQMTHCDDKNTRKHYINVKHQDTRVMVDEVNLLVAENRKREESAFLNQLTKPLKRAWGLFNPDNTRTKLEENINRLT